MSRFKTLPRFMDSEFGRLDDVVLSALDQITNYRMLDPNEFIYLQDDPADFVYFVRSGNIRLSYLLEDGSPTLFGVIPPGESFGELGVFATGRHYDMATSMGASSVYCIPAGAFRSLSARYPALNIALGLTIARRYRSYIALTRILGLKTLPARLSQCLLRLAESLNDRMLHGNREILQVGAFLTQSDLGLMARGARGNVNRTLKAWESDGLIAIRNRCILILDRQRLEAIAMDDNF